MDLSLDDERTALRDTIRRWAAGRALAPARACAEDPDAPLDRAHWDDLVALGAAGLLIPATAGGAGLGMVEAALVAAELGRVAAPLPWIATAVAAASIAADDLAHAIAAGDTIAAFVAADLDVIDGHVSGSATGVDGALGADVLVLATGDDSVWLTPATADGVTVARADTLDATRRLGDITFDSAATRRLDGDEAAAANATLRRDVALVADAVGAAEAALQLTLSYAGVREQFDRPIGSFQAVQHLCAEMLADIELARAGVQRAAWALDAADADTAAHDVAVAVAQAVEALPRVTGRAIQVHGGIGFTWEHDLHLLHKRVLSAQQLLGGVTMALDRLAALLD